MERETLKINVSDTVRVSFGKERLPFFESPFFQQQFKFTMNKDSNWAPARSRAPSVTIEFGLFEAD